MTPEEYNQRVKPLLLVNCDLLYGAGRSKYTLIQQCLYSDNPGEDVLACTVPVEECEDVEFIYQSRQGYIKYTEISPTHRIARLPLIPWYKRKISYVPENGSVLLS